MNDFPKVKPTITSEASHYIVTGSTLIIIKHPFSTFPRKVDDFQKCRFFHFVNDVWINQIFAWESLRID